MQMPNRQSRAIICQSDKPTEEPPIVCSLVVLRRRLFPRDDTRTRNLSEVRVKMADLACVEWSLFAISPCLQFHIELIFIYSLPSDSGPGCPPPDHCISVRCAMSGQDRSGRFRRSITWECEKKRAAVSSCFITYLSCGVNRPIHRPAGSLSIPHIWPS
jgi:hypothetical protein